MYSGNNKLPSKLGSTGSTKLGLPLPGRLNAKNKAQAHADAEVTVRQPDDDIKTDVADAVEIMSAIEDMDSWDDVSTDSSIVDLSDSSMEMPGTLDAPSVPAMEKEDKPPVPPSSSAHKSSSMPAMPKPHAASPSVSNLPASPGSEHPTKPNSVPAITRTPTVPAIHTVPAEQTKNTEPEAPEAPAIEAPAAESPAAESPAAEADAPEAPAIEAPAIEADAPEAPAHPEPELSDEEQMRAILESMTPEERAEYEAYEAREEVKRIEERRAKQRELAEMYGNPGEMREGNKTPIGLIIGAVIIIASIAAIIVYFLSVSDEKEKAEAAAQAAVEQEIKEQKAQEIAKNSGKLDSPLSSYDVAIERGAAETVYVNGQLVIGDTAKFVSGHINSIYAYADGMMPYFKTFTPNDTVSTAKIEMISDKLYPKKTVSFRLIDPEMANGAKVTWDGSSFGHFPGDMQGVALGVPHILTIEKRGFAKHMEIIWVGEKQTQATIRQLVPEEEYNGSASVMLSELPISAKPYGVQISISGHSTNAVKTELTVLGGDVAELYITREQRKPLRAAIMPEGFGSVTINAALKTDSLGSAAVSFNAPKDADFQICFRRPDEVICPPMQGETEIPSGIDWEIFAYRGGQDNPNVLRGIQQQQLSAGFSYKFAVSVEPDGLFKSKAESRTKIK